MPKQHSECGSAFVAGLVIATAVLLAATSSGPSTSKATSAEVERLVRDVRSYAWPASQVAEVVSFARRKRLHVEHYVLLAREIGAGQEVRLLRELVLHRAIVDPQNARRLEALWLPRREMDEARRLLALA